VDRASDGNLEAPLATSRRTLDQGDRRLARRFFHAAAKVVGPAWDMAVGGDLALPEVAGHRSRMVRITNAYVDRLLRVAEHDPIVAAAFGDVSDLLAPPGEIIAAEGGSSGECWRGNLSKTPAATIGSFTGQAATPSR
jgi:hypothetical protein